MLNKTIIVILTKCICEIKYLDLWNSFRNTDIIFLLKDFCFTKDCNTNINLGKILLGFD